MRGNGCTLTDEQLEQRRAEKRKAKKKVEMLAVINKVLHSSTFGD